MRREILGVARDLLDNTILARSILMGIFGSGSSGVFVYVSYMGAGFHSSQCHLLERLDNNCRDQFLQELRIVNLAVNLECLRKERMML